MAIPAAGHPLGAIVAFRCPEPGASNRSLIVPGKSRFTGVAVAERAPLPLPQRRYGGVPGELDVRVRYVDPRGCSGRPAAASTSSCIRHPLTPLAWIGGG
jgi:hypothetical protein